MTGRAWLAFALVASLAGCGGSAGSVTPNGHAAGAAARTRAQLVLKIPRPATGAAPLSASRRPAYLSPATASVTVTVYLQGSGTPLAGYPQTANLTPTSAGCSSTLATTECMLALSVGAAGSYSLTLVTYDQTGGAGNALSQATVPFTIVEGQNNTISVTLGGVAVSVMMVPSGIALSGSAALGYTLAPNHAATMSVFGLDADGNPIVGPGQGTISVSSSGGSGSLAITEPTTTSPNQVRLKSTSAVTGVTLTATLTPASTTGLGAVTATATITSPAPDTLYIPNYTVTGGGYGSIGVFDEEGNTIGTTGTFPGVDNPNSIAYDTANGWLYVSNVGGSSAGGGRLHHRVRR